MLVDLSPLKFENFRRLYFSQVVSMLGSQMTMVTIPFQIYGLTNSTFETGLVSSIELICLISTALWGGVFADRLDKRRIVVISDIFSLLSVLALAINAAVPTPSLWVIYILAGLNSAIIGFHRPAFEALTPKLIPQNEFPKVSSLMSFKSFASALLGPALAGYLLVGLGPVLTYMIDAASFLISLILLLRIKATLLKNNDEKNPVATSVFREIIEGARYIGSRKDVLGSYLVDFFAMVFCMPHVLFPAFAKMYGMNEWLGTLYMSIAAGGLLATLISAWTTKVRRLGFGIAWAAGGWSAAVLSVGLIHNFWWIFIGFFIAGVCDSYSGIFRLTMWNQSIPDEYRGRIASFSLLSYTSGPLLGQTLMGFLGDRLGLHESLRFGAGLSLLTIVVVVMFLPSFRAYDSRHYAGM